MKKSLLDVLKEHGITILPDFSVEKHREGSQWLFCYSIIVGTKEMQYAHFGDFKTGVEGSWEGYDGDQSPEEKKAFAAAKKESKKAFDEMQATSWAETSLEANRFLREECTDRGQPTPYLVRKKISSLHGASIWIHPDSRAQVLIVPLKDIDGKIWSYQRIFPEKLSLGDKFLQPGGKKQGCFFTFGTIKEGEPIYVCEGFATAASVFESSTNGCAVVAAIDTSNLKSVGRALRDKFNSNKIIFCADDDRWGTTGNAGLSAARAAAAECGGEIIWPRFTEAQSSMRPTDWNDLHCIAGLGAVREQIENPEKFKPEGEIIPIVSKGKPSEEDIAHRLIGEFKDNIIRQDNDLFVYKKTHWEMVETAGYIGIRNMIRATAPGKLTSRDVNSALQTFKDRIPHTPPNVSLFTPTPWCANFKNGTLHISRDQEGAYAHEFRPHAKEDYLTSCLPFEFLPDSTEVNHEFEAMLQRIWGTDPDCAAKVARYGEDLGAMFCGLFPSISIYQGKPGTGKSTLLLIASRLVHEANLCMVDPTQFEGFNMETMPGKLVNIVTDINTQRPISDELVKMITDRVKFRVRRKGLKDVQAYIPAIHLWGCNTLPKSFEGATGALKRRVTIIVTDTFQPEGKYNKEFHSYVFDKSPQGVYNFAVRSLLRLIENRGHYTPLESSARKMVEWGLDSDLVGMFLHEIEEGLVSSKTVALVVDPQGKMPRKDLWDLFLVWQKEEKGRIAPIGKIKFFTLLRSKGWRIEQDHSGARNFIGVNVGPVKNAQH